MYKVLARTASVRKQAARKLAKVEKEKAAKELREALRDRTTYEASRRKILKDAKKMAEEDWKLGPLAPRRDVGRVANTFGSLDQMDSTPPPALPQYKRWQTAMGKREASGKGWFGNQFYVNDRVVVIEGREKGKIAVVSEVNKRNQTVKLKNLNMVDVNYPDWLLEESQSDVPGNVTQLSYPISTRDVRLVYPITEDGVTREVIVDRMHIGRRSERTIPGLGITLKQATAGREKDEEVKSRAPTIREADTPRIRTERQTWVPTLQQPPMPPSVIDELRGKYSRFRTRHDDDWVAEKIAEDEKLEVKKKAVRLTRTPTQEYVLLQHQEAKKVAKEKVLTDDVLTILGEQMSRKTQLNSPQTAARETLLT